MIDAGVIDASIVTVHDPRQRRAQDFLDVVGGDSGRVGDRCDRGGGAGRCGLGMHADLGIPRPSMPPSPPGARCSVKNRSIRDLAAARSMAESAAASGLATQCGLVLRSAPVFRAFRDLVTGGTLGAPMAAIFRDDQFFPIQGHYASKWRSDVEQAGGGCLIEHSIHDVDILRFCFGDVRRLSRTGNFAGYEGIEDLAAVTLSFESGFEAQLTSVWHNILSRGSTRRIELFCSAMR